MDDETKEFINELIDHLNYCGWGDRWERECSEELRKKAERFQSTGEIG